MAKNTGIQVERNKENSEGKKIKNDEWEETFEYGRTEKQEKRMKEKQNERTKAGKRIKWGKF